MTGDVELMASFGSDNEQAGTESKSSGKKRSGDMVEVYAGNVLTSEYARNIDCIRNKIHRIR